MTADDVNSWANGFLIFSLILGVVATYAIVASSKIKEDQLNKEIAASNERAAEANARATEAALALEKFKAPRVLSVVSQQNITAKVRSFAGVHFDVAATQDGEATNLLTSIEDCLNAAGWHEVSVSGMATISRNGRPPLGIVVEYGVSIQVAQSMQQRLLPIAKALVNALKDEGIEARDEFEWRPSPNQNVIHVFVGQKPR